MVPASLSFPAPSPPISSCSSGRGCPARLKLPTQAVSLLLGSGFESLQAEKGIEAKSLVSWGSAETTSSYAKQKADVYRPFLPPLVVLSNESVHGGCALGESGLAVCTRTCLLEKVHAGTTIMPLAPAKEQGRFTAGAGLGSRGIWGSLCARAMLSGSVMAAGAKGRPPYLSPIPAPKSCQSAPGTQKGCPEVWSERGRAEGRAPASHHSEENYLFDFINKIPLPEEAVKRWKCVLQSQI